MKNPLYIFRSLIAMLMVIVFFSNCGKIDRGLSYDILDFIVENDSGASAFQSVNFKFIRTDKNSYDYDDLLIEAFEDVNVEVQSPTDTINLRIKLNYEFDSTQVTVVDYGYLFGSDWEPKFGIDKADLYQQSLKSFEMYFDNFKYSIEDATEISNTITFSERPDSDRYNVLMKVYITDQLMNANQGSVQNTVCELRRLSLNIGLE